MHRATAVVVLLLSTSACHRVGREPYVPPDAAPPVMDAAPPDAAPPVDAAPAVDAAGPDAATVPDAAPPPRKKQDMYGCERDDDCTEVWSECADGHDVVNRRFADVRRKQLSRRCGNQHVGVLTVLPELRCEAGRCVDARAGSLGGFGR